MIKNIKPVNEYILLKFDLEEEKKTSAGIIIPAAKADQKNRENATIIGLGPKVEARDFKIGDKVIVNDFDIKRIEGEDGWYGLTKASSVFATYTAS
ncbi:MAG TPA: co-chaperone GroES [Candidatus Paceibacterota bacterium]|nr:co-chaperone GroES [Candidatus Paceibacterota bacterium]